MIVHQSMIATVVNYNMITPIILKWGTVNFLVYMSNIFLYYKITHCEAMSHRSTELILHNSHHIHGQEHISQKEYTSLYITDHATSVCVTWLKYYMIICKEVWRNICGTKCFKQYMCTYWFIIFQLMFDFAFNLNWKKFLN